MLEAENLFDDHWNYEACKLCWFDICINFVTMDLLHILLHDRHFGDEDVFVCHLFSKMYDYVFFQLYEKSFLRVQLHTCLDYEALCTSRRPGICSFIHITGLLVMQMFLYCINILQTEEFGFFISQTPLVMQKSQFSSNVVLQDSQNSVLG